MYDFVVTTTVQLFFSIQYDVYSILNVYAHIDVNKDKYSSLNVCIYNCMISYVLCVCAKFQDYNKIYGYKSGMRRYPYYKVYKK